VENLRVARPSTRGGGSWSPSSANQLRQSGSYRFLLRFHSCDRIRDCLAELSHRRSQIPSPASWRRAGEIMLASSGDIVGTEEWEGQYV
jgi:hypothetical protein